IFLTDSRSVRPNDPTHSVTQLPGRARRAPQFGHLQRRVFLPEEFYSSVTKRRPLRRERRSLLLQPPPPKVKRAVHSFLSRLLVRSDGRPPVPEPTRAAGSHRLRTIHTRSFCFRR